MSQAEELLNSIADQSSRLADVTTEPHIVIGDDRVIVVPKELQRIAVQFDHDVETVTFDCPRYWDDLDMSQLGIYINYIRKDKALGCYRAENITIDETNDRIMHFDWTISQNVSLVEGPIKFLVCIRKMDDEGYEQNHWNSELNEEMYVSEGLECGEVVLEPYPDIVSQWAEDVEEVKNILLSARDAGEFNGATFTPTVTEEGDISWTNNLGFPNPKTVNIHGATFTPHMSDNFDLSWTNDKGLVNPQTMHLRGDDGVSPTIEVAETVSGHSVTVTDVNGTKTFNVLNGGTEVIDQYMKNFFTISDTEPASGPVLWFDTTSTVE